MGRGGTSVSLLLCLATTILTKTPTFVYVLQSIAVMGQERTGRVEVAQEVGVVFRKERNDKESPDQEMKEKG